MDQERFRRLQEIFDRAREMDPGERATFLDRECRDDDEARAEVESLLRHHAAAGGEESRGEESRGEEAGEPDPDATVDVPTPSPSAFDPDEGDGDDDSVDAGSPASLSRHIAGGACETLDDFGPFRVLERLGAGGMGEVYLAEQREPIRRRVVLKLIQIGMSSKEMLGRFEIERQALALMSHPNVARVFDAGTTPDGRPYFVMEHVPGEPITTYCDRHRLDIRERLRLFREVCSGVQHAHQKGIIHRDIKPGNVLVMRVDGRPSAKLIDFGVAKATDLRLTERTVYTEVGRMIGTLEYMSPEQAEMRPTSVDTRTDIYSLGVLLYELLVGVLPFDSRTLRGRAFDEMQRMIREEEPPRPSTRLTSLGGDSTASAGRRGTDVRTLSRQLRQDLDWVIVKPLEKDPARRYQTVAELSDDIGRYLEGRPVEAGPPGILYRARKFAARNRRPLAATFLVLLAVIGTLGWRSVEKGVRRAAARGEAREALDRGDPEGARRAIGRLEELGASRALVDLLERETTGVERSRMEEVARRRLEEGNAAWEAFRSARDERDRLERVVRRYRIELPGHLPAWMRTEELDAWRSLAQRRTEAGRLYGRIVNALLGAREVAPPGSRARRDVEAALERVWVDRYREAVRSSGVRLSPDFFRARLEAMGLAASTIESGPERLSIASAPAGAEVHCFRYEKLEGRLVPLAFRPGPPGAGEPGRVVGRPILRLERVWDPSLEGFEEGDVWLSVAGREVATRTDLAGALADVEADATVDVRVSRNSTTRTVRWTPFPAARYRAWREEDERTPYRPGALIHIRRQLGITFEGNPLERREACRLGATEEGRGIEVELPEGSYLLLFRKAGHADTRVPVAVPGAPTRVEAELLPDADVPAGFVPLVRGPVAHGGDPEAFQDLERGEAVVDTCLVARFEVTVREYLEFVNDLTASGRLGADGRLEEASIPIVPEPASDWERWRLEEGRWRTGWPDEWPVSLVSQRAASEYARWRTAREAGPWRFRLPTDLEWEKAARGVDRRFHVWGDRLVMSFAKTADSMYGPANTEMVGAYPFDESVYGVRDLAGSVAELTSDLSDPPYRYVSVRGGSWYRTDAFYFRAATRNGLLPEGSGVDTGIRLVAERRESEGAAPDESSATSR